MNPLLPVMEPAHFLHSTPVRLIVSLSQLDASYHMNSWCLYFRAYLSKIALHILLFVEQFYYRATRVDPETHSKGPVLECYIDTVNTNYSVEVQKKPKRSQNNMKVLLII